MSITNVYKLLKKNGLVTYKTEVIIQAETVGIKCEKGFFIYNEFIGLLARPIFYAALSNLSHLLINNIKCTDEALSFKISNYQRGIYIEGIKNEPKGNLQYILNNAQKLLMKDKHCTNLSMYI